MNKNKKTAPWRVVMVRELKSYFTNPVAYIVSGLFLVYCGFMFFPAFFIYKSAELRQFFNLLPGAFSFFIPALTMRVFSEEKHSGTMETLVTLPVTELDIVVGKYLASFISSIVLLVPTLFYVITVCIFGNPDAGPVIGGYLGAVFMSASFCAIGVFASSVTKNQLLSFVLSCGISFVLTVFNWFEIFMPGAIVPVVDYICARTHFSSIARGIVDTRDIIYFASLTAVFLVLTYFSVKKSKLGNTKNLGIDVGLFAAVLILLNMVSANAFLRMDITSSKAYSLSKASKEVVKNIEEPLSVKVFFNKNLPSPYSGVEQYVKDILVEYKNAADKKFSVEYFNMDKEENIKQARDYGLSQIQIREVKNNEVGYKNVYMGIVITYADQIEKLDGITSTDRLEYNITTTIGKIIANTNILTGLAGNINLTLYKSEELNNFSISGFDKIDKSVEKAVESANKKYNGKIEFRKENPSSEQVQDLAGRYGIQDISWKNKDGTTGHGTIGLVLEYDDKIRLVPLTMQRMIFQNVIIGLDELDENLSSGIENIVSKTSAVAYVTGHGEADIYDTEKGAGNFNNMVSDIYSLQEINLKENDIPSGIQTVLINGPKTAFDDDELYKLDQFLMKGGNIMYFVDAFEEVMPQGQNMYYQMPQYIPVRTGLEKLFSSYGVEFGTNYVMDKNCYVQNNEQYGQKLNFSYVPLLQKENLSQKNPITKNLGYVLFMQQSSIDISGAKENKNLKTTVLANTSKDSWRVSDNIILNPFYTQEPAEKTGSENIAVLLEGKFTSAYEDDPSKEQAVYGTDMISKSHLSQGTQNGKVLLVSSSMITGPQLIGPNNSGEPIAIFLQNSLDYMNGNQEYCTMRSKNLNVNVLKTDNQILVAIAKYFNEIGLPVLVALVGLLVLLARKQRREQIRLLFDADDKRIKEDK